MDDHFPYIIYLNLFDITRSFIIIIIIIIINKFIEIGLYDKLEGKHFFFFFFEENKYMYNKKNKERAFRTSKQERKTQFNWTDFIQNPRHQLWTFLGEIAKVTWNFEISIVTAHVQSK